jgi:hypothetical protein
VALIDADVGLRNLDLLLGLENRVLYTAIDILEGDCRCVLVCAQLALVGWQLYSGVLLPHDPRSRQGEPSNTPERVLGRWCCNSSCSSRHVCQPVCCSTPRMLLKRLCVLRGVL